MPRIAQQSVIACPSFPNTVDVVQDEEGQAKGQLSGSVPPESIYVGAVRGPRAVVERLDITGLQRRILFESPSFDYRDPDYSPQLDKLVYASDETGGLEIWAANGDGSGKARLTIGFGDNTRQFGARRPRWSPDGRGIVFESNVYDVIAQDNTLGRVYRLFYLAWDPKQNVPVIPLSAGGTATARTPPVALRISTGAPSRVARQPG